MAADKRSGCSPEMEEIDEVQKELKKYTDERAKTGKNISTFFAL